MMLQSWRTKIINLRYIVKSSSFGWILQFPLFQQLAYFAIFLELYEIDVADQKEVRKSHEIVKQVVDSSEEISSSKESIEIAKECDRLQKKKTMVMNDFLNMKLYEAFLEAAPQAILQIMIVFRKGFSDPMDVFTISTSLLSLTACATNLFWKYPTKVHGQTDFSRMIK